MFFPPLAAYLIDRIFFRQTGNPVRLGLVFGLLVVVQFFSGLEILLDVAVVAVPVLILAAVTNPRQITAHVRFAAISTATALATAGAVLIYPLIVYFDGPYHVGSLGQAVRPGAALPSLVWPSAATGHDFFEAPPGTPWQHLFDDTFVGPLVIVLALAALIVARRHRVVLLLWAATLWSVVLSWGGSTRLTGASPPLSWHAPAWYLSAAVPILKNVGWIRLSILTDVLLALLVAITLQALVSAVQVSGVRWRGPLSEFTVVGAGVLMVIPLLAGSNVPYAGFQAVAIPEVLQHIPTGTNGAVPIVLVFPAGSPVSGTSLAWQAVAGFPYRNFEGYAWHPQPGKQAAIAGATSSLPDYLLSSSSETSPSVTVGPKLSREIAVAFTHYGVRFAVVIDGYPGSDQLTRVYDQVFGSSRRYGDGQIWTTCRAGTPVPQTPACNP